MGLDIVDVHGNANPIDNFYLILFETVSEGINI